MLKPINIFTRTFLFTCSMLISMIFVVFILVYAFLPQYYTSYQTENIKQQFEANRTILEQSLTLSEELAVLQQLAESGDSGHSFILRDEAGKILYELNQMTHGINLVTNEHNVEEEDLKLKTENLFDTFSLELSYFIAGEERLIELFIPLHTLSQARRVIMNLYPLAALVSILFALVLALIFSRWVVVPINKIRNATARMALMDPDAMIDLPRNDELGALSVDINSLYRDLRLTIIRLEKEIEEHTDTENRKINFLQTVSHEMKTPLASANALLEGIIYDVPPYSIEPKYYLEECQSYLEKTIALAKESLSLSGEYDEESKIYNLQQIVQEVSTQYQIIFRSKQLVYQEEIPESVTIYTKLTLFKRILSNLYSNAANHSDPEGSITITFNENCLAITNTCQPLTHEELEIVFNPFISKTKSPHSSGLGLTITHQLLKQLKMLYEFTQTEKKTGWFSVFLSIHEKEPTMT